MLGIFVERSVKMENYQFYQDKTILFEHGIISRRGYRDNKTDCEVDRILIHVPSGNAKRFHGSWYDKDFAIKMKKWIESFPKSQEGITIEKLNELYSCGSYTLNSKETLYFK